ncbi:MAG: HAD-IB family phosphatase [Clostridia bacterium]|nr:HAD-IB family phosphatase [Clostridia bacterium]
MKKAVVFDFDGTLTQKNQNIWKMLWEKCGYTTDKNSLYAELYVRHVIKKEISREEWFNLTCDAFKNKKMTYFDFYDVSEQIKLINGARETILDLYNRGYSLFIVSGCIRETIEIVLGDYVKYFEDIESNLCVFDMNGNLQKLIPTDYDYEGKAKYVDILKSKGYSPENIVFVGNADNDEWVYQTGCKTICINPQNADVNNSKKWKKVYHNVTDLRQIFDISPNEVAAGETLDNELNR